MVRTKADCSGVRVTGAKAPRKIVILKPTEQSSGSSSANYSGGNPYKPQPTPPWQKEITTFFSKGRTVLGEGATVNSSENTPTTEEKESKNSN